MNELEISKRVCLYLLITGGFERLSRLSKPLSRLVWSLKYFWSALWLGMLDADTLNEITRVYYMGESGFEAEDFNINQGLWPWEAELIKNHFQGNEHVLVAGAGGGREVIALARLGYRVTAFDFSSHLTEACRLNLDKSGCIARVLEAPPDGIPEGLETHDALLVGRGFYHHIPGRLRRIAFLKACMACLAVGAPVILSDFFTRTVDSRFYRRAQALANCWRRLRNQSERVELGDWLTNTMQHAFTREEIEREFLEAGIKLEVYAISPFGEDSRLAHAVGRTR